MTPARRPGRLARLLSAAALYVAVFVFIAIQTAAASAQHAHDALVTGGQGKPDWLPWTLAGTPELLAVLATLEYRHRRKTYGADADVSVPRAIIVASALVLMGAQLVTAQRTALGMFAAAWPALAFLVAVALIETRPRPAAQTPHVGVSRKPADESPDRMPEKKPAPRPHEPAPSPLSTSEEPPPEVAARLDALDDYARNVYGVLAAAEPGATLTPAEIRAATGLPKDRSFRATQRLVAADLAVSPAPGRYAARRIEAVA
jgi:hypothetical protein